MRMRSSGGTFEVLAYVRLAGKAAGPVPNSVTRMELSADRKKIGGCCCKWQKPTEVVIVVVTGI